MDWDLKIPPWDMAELERDSEPNMGSGSMTDCSVDLKLGGLGDFGSTDKFRDQHHHHHHHQQQQQQPKMPTVVSTPGPSKRARAASNGSQNVSCSVDGCKSDLSNCREYHRRHKVCEVHSKTPMVMVGGQEQRFCQQCSRFHLLIEFDEVKRSCRKRLDGHNRRRRKPQPAEINPAGMFASHQGARFSSYAQMFSTTSLAPNWTSIVKPEHDALYSHHQQMLLTDRQQGFAAATAASLSSGSCYYKSGRQFPFLHDMNGILSSRAASEISVCQPFLKPILASETSSSSSRTFSADCTLTQVIDSDCALSLLSSPTQGSPGISHSRMISTNRTPMAQPLVSGMQYESIGRYSSTHQAANSSSSTRFSCSAMEDGHLGTLMISDASETDELQCQESSHGFPFPWQ